MSTIYQCLTKVEKTIPTHYLLKYEAETETEAINYLRENGGGIYRNILHGFDCTIEGIDRTFEKVK